MVKAIAFFFFGAAAALLLGACGGQVTGTGGAGGQGGNAGTSGSAGTAGTGNASGSAGSAGTSGDFVSCTGDTICVLAVPGCCEPCSAVDISAYVAVDAAKLAAYHESVCPDPQPCPACDPLMDPNFFAYCDAGKCVAADVRTHAVSACKSPSDCTLRNGSACCEECAENPYQVIAVSFTADPSLGELVCVGDVGCPKCLPQYPPNTVASCEPDGHCAAVMLMP